MKTNTFLIILSLSVFLAFASAEDGECDPGYYISGSGSCKECPRGTFQDKPGRRGCKPCPDGTASVEAGSTECTKCSENKEPTEFKNSCVCIEGSFLQRRSGTCIFCEPGTRFAQKNGRNRCFRCSRGYYQPLAGQLECLKCPEGSFSDIGASECTSCPQGERLIAGVCATCPAGEFYEFDSCSACNAGTFKAKAGFGPCLPCPPNTSSKASASKCKPTGCPEGEATMKKGKCGKCPAGTYYDKFGKKCEKCDKNYFMPYESIATDCFQCAGTSYAKKPGAKECIKCPLGQRLLKSGECGTCPAGYFYEEQKCRKCGLNEYSRGNMDYCERCPEGTYALRGASTCFACPVGQVLIGEKCGKCLPGQYLDEFRGRCRRCERARISPGGLETNCIPCPDGKKANKERSGCIDE